MIKLKPCLAGDELDGLDHRETSMYLPPHSDGNNSSRNDIKAQGNFCFPPARGCCVGLHCSDLDFSCISRALSG